jgi:parvulin-like peptidyl-prolyl isomerase
MLILIVMVMLTALSPGLLAQAPVAAHQPTLPASPAVKAPETPVVRVNGVVLTEGQLREEMQRIFPYYATHGGQVPASAEPEIRQKAVHELVLHELVYQEARRRNLQLPATVFEKRLRQMRQAFPSRQEYEQAAAKKYGSVPEFRRRLRQAMLTEQLWDAEVARKSVVTAQEMRTYYQSNKARFVRPEAVWLQSITIKFPENATAAQKQEARKRAEEILPKAKAAKNYEEFGVLAEQVSEDDWRVMMGDHKWVHRGSVTPELQSIFSMKPAETSGLVESPTGYLILRLNERQPPKQMSLAEVSGKLRKGLEKDRSEKRAQQFEQRLRSNAKIEML